MYSENSFLRINNFMTNTATYAQLSTCSTILEFRNSLKMNLTLNIPSAYSTTNALNKLELYRYIGNLSECVNPQTITDNSKYSKLICTITQTYNSSNIKNGSSIEYKFPYTMLETSPLNIYEHTTINDDFASIINTPDSTNLNTFHKLGIPSSTNKEIIDDICYTRRPIYYVLKSYEMSNNTINSELPYILTPNNMDRTFINHSTKTQVRHDYLHYEGDEIWAAWVVDAAQPCSRTVTICYGCGVAGGGTYS